MGLLLWHKAGPGDYLTHQSPPIPLPLPISQQPPLYIHTSHDLFTLASQKPTNPTTLLEATELHLQWNTWSAAYYHAQGRNDGLNGFNY